MPPNLILKLQKLAYLIIAQLKFIKPGKSTPPGILAKRCPRGMNAPTGKGSRDKQPKAQP